MPRPGSQDGTEDDPPDRTSAGETPSFTATLHDDTTRARITQAIQLTESALVEVSLAGVQTEIIRAYLGVISDLHALRDGRSRPLPNARIGDLSIARGKTDASSLAPAREYRLTKRQRAVLELMLTGASTRRIAASLGLAEGTVKIHLTGIYRTLGVTSRAEAIAKLK
jgi:DNA-binding CsgD family transcriptional regulator